MAAKPSIKASYQGPLAIPVAMPKAPAAVHILGPDNPDVQAAIRIESDRITKELLGKLPLLLDHFAISRDASDCWYELAYRLARAHVPGFQTVAPSKVGAPQEWGELELTALHIEVEILTKQGMTAMDACRALVRLPDGSWRFPRSRDAKTLYRRYQQAKKLAIVIALRNTKCPEIKQIIEESITETVAERSGNPDR